MSEEKKIELRRQPEQARSRARMQAILDVTADLIGQHGADAISMTQIASQAGMSKAALYRYFPNRQAVIRELALTEYRENRSKILQTVSNLTEDPRVLLRQGLCEYCDQYRRDANRSQIRAAVHADAELSALDLSDSRTNAASIAEFLIQRGVQVPSDVLQSRVLLIIELLDGVIRTLRQVSQREAGLMLNQFADMAVHHIFDTSDT